MNVENSLFEKDNDKALAEADARALADIKAGRVVENDKVIQWLKTWGTENEGPPPAEWFK
ncbi:MAG: antitoxin [Pseudomonadota bacterium]